MFDCRFSLNGYKKVNHYKELNIIFTAEVRIWRFTESDHSSSITLSSKQDTSGE